MKLAENSNNYEKALQKHFNMKVRKKKKYSYNYCAM